MLAKQKLIWQKKKLRKNQLKDSSTKMYQKKSGRKSRDTPNQYSIDQYSKIYPKYDLKSTSVNTWKTKCKSNKENTLINKIWKTQSFEWWTALKDWRHNWKTQCMHNNIKKNGHCNWNRCEFVLSIFWSFRLNPRVQREHLTSQLSWVAAWLLVTNVFAFYLVEELVLAFLAILKEVGTLEVL